jgi:hypothetical protein
MAVVIGVNERRERVNVESEPTVTSSRIVSSSLAALIHRPRDPRMNLAIRCRRRPPPRARDAPDDTRVIMDAHILTCCNAQKALDRVWK